MKAKVFSFAMMMTAIQSCGANPQEANDSTMSGVRQTRVAKDDCVAMAKEAAENADVKRTPLLPGQQKGVAVSTRVAPERSNSFTRVLIVTVIRESEIVELGKFIVYKVTLRAKGAAIEGCSAVTKVEFLKEFGNAIFDPMPRIGVGN